MQVPVTWLSQETALNSQQSEEPEAKAAERTASSVCSEVPKQDVFPHAVSKRSWESPHLLFLHSLSPRQHADVSAAGIPGPLPFLSETGVVRTSVPYQLAQDLSKTFTAAVKQQSAAAQLA